MEDVERGGLIEDFGSRTIADEGYSNQLIKKWSPLLEGLKREDHRKLLAFMFENETQHLKGKMMLSEQTKAADVGPFTKFIFPILRRVFPNLIAPDIFSVQPMSSPVGAVFFFDMVYATAKGAVPAGNLFVKDFNRYYSSEYIDGERVGAGTGSQTVFSNTLKFVPVRNSAGYVSNEMLKIQYTIAGTTYTAFANSSGVITGTLISSGSVNYSNGQISVTFSTAPDASTYVACFYEYIGEANASVPQVNLQIQMQEVRAYSRKLKSLVSSEAQEDLQAFHGLDAEGELTTHIGDEIALEIDRELITDVQRQAAGGTATWSRQVPAAITEVEHIRSFLTQLSNVSNAIHRATMRAPANWAIVSPEIASLIEQLQTHGDFRPNVFMSEPSLPMPYGMFGIFPMGTLLNRWMVYRDPFLTPTSQVLLGLKGKSFMDAGFAWAPYIPLQVTQTFLDPSDFTLKKGMRTRYAKKMLRPEFYGTVNVTNL